MSIIYVLADKTDNSWSSVLRMRNSDACCYSYGTRIQCISLDVEADIQLRYCDKKYYNYL